MWHTCVTVFLLCSTCMCVLRALHMYSVYLCTSVVHTHVVIYMCTGACMCVVHKSMCVPCTVCAHLHVCSMYICGIHVYSARLCVYMCISCTCEGTTEFDPQ